MSKYFSLITALAILRIVLRACERCGSIINRMKPPIAKKVPKVLKIMDMSSLTYTHGSRPKRDRDPE
jgi:hypothetical protein